MRTDLKLRHRRLQKVAFVLAFLLFAESVFPVKAFALTGGPSQPEVESFEPVTTTNMVSPFTGDFNYNIPLMTVPGPNGGYPINLAYHAGIGMEQEASWVGLGWNINAGVINRNMRGLPDDFNGDPVTKTLVYKPQETTTFDYSAFSLQPYTNQVTQVVTTYSPLGGSKDSVISEQFGFEAKRAIFAYQIHYNNYKGLGMGISMNLTSATGKATSSKFSTPLTISFDTDGGLGVVPSIAYNDKTKKAIRSYSIGLGYNSRQGITGLKIASSKTTVKSELTTTEGESEFKDHYRMTPGGNLIRVPQLVSTSKYISETTSSETSPGCSVNFAFNNQLPNFAQSYNTLSFSTGLTYGKLDPSVVTFKKYKKRRFVVSAVKSESALDNKTYQGYGYNNLQSYTETEQEDMADFAREKQAPATKNAPNISIGYPTYDALFVTGQGVAGAFRPFRSNATVLQDPAQVSNVVTAKLQPEFGDNVAVKPAPTSPSFELGGDAGVGYSRSYSGDWKSPALSAITSGLADLFNIDNEIPVSTDPLYQSTYYRSSGEMAVSELTDMDYIRGTRPMRFGLEQIFSAEYGILPKIVDKIQENDGDNSGTSLSGNTIRSKRTPRSQLLTYRSVFQLANTTGYGRSVASYYTTPNVFPSTGATPITYNYSTRPSHHIGEITVTNPDGNRYVYGLPVYNNTQKEMYFSTDNITENDFSKVKTYTANVDNSKNNTRGLDRLFSSTEIPQYAYSYLITAIYSPDYVDLKGDGPTDDDFGYWVKFNYTQAQSQYKWRIPYRDASLSKGAISDPTDDKLSYMYGTKEIYYLNSIQTKTHEARFKLNNNSVQSERRRDGNGVTGENFLTATGIGTQNQLNRLESIELVSRKDVNKVIKKIDFKYEFTLCKGVSNSTGSTATNDNGKLTLKQIYFTSLGNTKGTLSPYVFEYGQFPYGTSNPNYNEEHMDRWGFYRPDKTTAEEQLISKENPYVDQRDGYATQQLNASAWNLSSIALPSGGRINVEYESDDYAYVQNLPAMQMQRIRSISPYTMVNADGSAGYNSTLPVKLNDRNLIVFFDLNQPIQASSTTAQQKLDLVKPYVDGIEDLYFKVFMKLKKQRQGANTGKPAIDYVEGYAKIDKSQAQWFGFGPVVSNQVTTGWIRIKAEERNPWNPLGQTDHPFKLAGWQYLRLQRNDLFDNGNLLSVNSNIQTFISGIITAAQDFPRQLGFYRFCQLSGYCNELYLQTDAAVQIQAQPSWIRLNAPTKHKYGGGHRVKKISITDNWNQMSLDQSATPMTYSYGMEYSYTLPDGSSSGVAEYEPAIGAEEIPQHKPLRYNQRKYNYKDDGLYVEEPFGESLYPAPNVGYSRVVVKNTDYAGVTINRSGISVTEFYTAKDFPINSTYTDLKKKGFGLPVFVPMILEIGYNNRGYSQGFTVELNNMHGQLKSEAMYAAGADINNPLTQPVSKTEFIYKTEAPYAPDRENRLNNQVTVLDADGVYRQALIGQTHEFSIDRQQHSNYSIGAGVETNAGATPPYTFWGSLYPTAEISASMYRSISTLKVIQRNGILDEVRSYKDGAYAVSKNLMYDAQTGQPLLTQTINDFDKPIFDYKYAAHWAYPGMRGAYQNSNANFSGVTITNGTYSIANPAKYFTPGDEVHYFNSTTSTYIPIWVNTVNDALGTVTFINESNSSAINLTNVSMEIVRSGYRNQQTVGNGTIVSLSNPVTQRRVPLIDAFNAFNTTSPPPGTPNLNGTSGIFNNFYTDCATGQPRQVTINWIASNNTLDFVDASNNNCQIAVKFPTGHGITNLITAFTYDLQISNGQAFAFKNGNTYPLILLTPFSPNCPGTCLDDVLHADAASFNDNWAFNYNDLGNPAYKVTGSNATTFTTTPNANPYRFGTKGIWRNEQSWVYQVDRKQDGNIAALTNIAKDGTYNYFVPFNWNGTKSTLAGINTSWTLANTVTQYSPYGFELENKDALNVFSSALYGYSNSLATAVASNCRYEELAFDGFEDYDLSTSTYVNQPGHGHLEFRSVNTSVPINITSSGGHTGKSCLAVSSNGPAIMTLTSGSTQPNLTVFNPIPGQQYHLSLWVNVQGAPASVSNASVSIVNATTSTTLVTATPDPKFSALDGWKRIDAVFTAPASGQTLTIKLQCSSTLTAAACFDDIRIQPFVSGLKSYVYDPATLWLMAELDDRNYATFYNYDEEGALVQVKKETEKGIVTIRSSRNNTKR